MILNLNKKGEDQTSPFYINNVQWDPEYRQDHF